MVNISDYVHMHKMKQLTTFKTDAVEPRVSLRLFLASSLGGAEQETRVREARTHVSVIKSTQGDDQSAANVTYFF